MNWTANVIRGALGDRPRSIAGKRLIPLLPVLASLVMALSLGGAITERPLTSDSHQNVRMAYHLVTSGVISYATRANEDIVPTMRREPAPIAALALLHLIHPNISSEATLEGLTHGPYVIYLKQINSIYSFIFFTGIFSIFDLIFKKKAASFTLALLTNLFTIELFLSNRMDVIFTELPAAALMVWATAMMLRLARDRTAISAILAGVIFGLLALTKGSFLYIGMVALFVLAAYLWKQDRSSGTNEKDAAQGSFVWLRLPAIAALVFVLICGAWMTRNLIHFNQFVITERGGDVLYYRLLTMEQPILGAVYVFSPNAYRPWVGARTGYRLEDLETGQPLAALSRQSIVESIHRQRGRIYRERMEAAGEPYEEMAWWEIERWLGREALKAYAADPIGYIKWTAVFAYRGSFAGARDLGFLRKWGSALPEHVTLLLYLNFLVVGVGAIVLLRPTLGLVFLLPVGMYVFHAMFSHNIPRYNEPLIPFLALAVFMSGAGLLRVARQFRANPARGASGENEAAHGAG